MTRTELEIKGMTCGNCERFVAMVLSSVPGISAVEVSLEKGNAILTSANERALEEAIAAINDTGTYRVDAHQTLG